jgi:hypothetical protein
MLVTLLGIVTLVRPVQPVNALSPMLVTLLGIVTLVRRNWPWNALSPMRVTGWPLTAAGITNSLAEPVYFIIEIWLLLVV